MLEYARWKYVLIAVVLLLALLFALPNVFGQDPALQVERKDRAPMDDFARQTIEDLLRKQQIAIKRDYLDSGRLLLAFNDVAAQLKARDTVDATLSDLDRSALSNATRAPAWMRALGLKAMPLGLDLRGCQRAVEVGHLVELAGEGIAAVAVVADPAGPHVIAVRVRRPHQRAMVAVADRESVG